MFRAVRKWWVSGRGQNTARLFVFELTVVMIGVLAAQQVSNWANYRSAIGQVEGLHDDLFHSFGAYRAIAQANQVAIPCIEERVDLLLTLAAEGRVATPALLAPARLMGMGPDQISAEDWRLIRERYGDSDADAIGSVEFNLRTVERSGDEMDRLWFEFQRLNGKHGPVSEADRSAVRDAGVRMKGSLYALRTSNNFILKLVNKLDVPHWAGTDLRPVSNCDEMWQSGKGYRGD